MRIPAAIEFRGNILLPFSWTLVYSPSCVWDIIIEGLS